MKKTIDKIIKSLIYRAYSIIIAFGITLLITRSFEQATILTILIESIQTFSYFIFELIWEKVTKNRKRILS